MSRIEIYIRLKLPNNSNGSEAWEQAIEQHLKEHKQLEHITMFMDEEQEVMNLSFSFEGQVKLHAIIEAILRSGAQILQQIVLLPGSYSGIEDAHDMREVSKPICELIQVIEGVNEVSIDDNGIIRISCNAIRLDELISLAIKRLRIRKQEQTKNED